MEAKENLAWWAERGVRHYQGEKKPPKTLQFSCFKIMDVNREWSLIRLERLTRENQLKAGEFCSTSLERNFTRQSSRYLRKQSTKQEGEESERWLHVSGTYSGAMAVSRGEIEPNFPLPPIPLWRRISKYPCHIKIQKFSGYTQTTPPHFSIVTKNTNTGCVKCYIVYCSHEKQRFKF